MGTKGHTDGTTGIAALTVFLDPALFTAFGLPPYPVSLSRSQRSAPSPVAEIHRFLHIGPHVGRHVAKTPSGLGAYSYLEGDGMKIPGVPGLVSSLAGGVTGGAAQVVRAGANAATGAAGTVQMLASPVVELAGPVVQSVAQSTGRVLGNSSAGSANHVELPVRWQSGRRVHLDLDPLLPFPRWDEHAAVVEEPVRRIPGVAEAHVEGSLGRLVFEIEEDADADTVLDEVRDVVGAVAADLTLAGATGGPKTAPFADPGNPLAILVPLTAAAMDVVAVTAAVTGWVTRLPAAPQTTRAAAALINHQPRMVSLLESRLGRVGTDIALAAATAAANGLTQAVGTPMLDLAQRSFQLSEAAAHRRVWRDREPAAGLAQAAASAGGPRHLVGRGKFAGGAAQLGCRCGG